MNLSLVRALVFLSLLSPLSVAAAQTSSSPADGVWLGTLHAGAQTLRLQVHLRVGPAGAGGCTLDSLDQGAPGIPCNNVQFSEHLLSFDVPNVHGEFSGTLSADGKTLTGTWVQGGALPLVLERQAAAIATPKATPPPPPSTDAAIAPVGVADLKPVLDRDLAIAVKSGALAPETHAGVTIAVVQHGVERIFSYGTAKPDSIFEIGSITKTFTGLLLAQMTEQGTVKLDEPVRDLLPPGTVAKPASGAEITLLDLSDQHAGLPRMPDNLYPADKSNPYADYDAKLMYAFLAKQGVAHAADAPFLYSNFGVALLGQALANRANVPYATLLHEQITGPLNMRDTAIALTPEMQARFIEGHDGSGKPAHAWDLNAFAGAGGIRSTAADMLTYLKAQLHPDHLPAGAMATPDGKTLPSAIQKTHVIHADVGGGEHIALNWFRVDGTGSYWHNGATGGYTSYALFNPEKDFAVIVLCNAEPGPGAFADNLGHHIEARLTGSPAITLAVEQPKVVDVDAKVLEGYVGAYELAPNFILTVTREGNRLITQATGQQKIEIFPESEKKFFVKVMDAQITFETDDQGRATGMILHQNGMDHAAKRVK
jgi:serine-type D-Ala-D-Ala carboxypeptidase/endopeptidase